MPLSEKEVEAIRAARIALCFEPCHSNAYNNGVRIALKEVAKALGANCGDKIFDIIDAPAPDSVEAWIKIKEKKRR